MSLGFQDRRGILVRSLWSASARGIASNAREVILVGLRLSFGLLHRPLKGVTGAIRGFQGKRSLHMSNRH